MTVRTIVYSLITVLFHQAVYSQANQPNKWRVGWFGEIDFTGSFGVPLLCTDTIGTDFSNTFIWDNSGDMIIYSNGFNVFDVNMDIMPGGPLLYDSTWFSPPSTYGSSLTDGTIILSRPAHLNQYYIFHSSVSVSAITVGKLYYSIIDLNLNNGLGSITSVKNVLLDDTTWTGYLSAVCHGNGRDWWLVSGRNYSNVINTWLVQPDTIIGPFSQPVGLSLTWPQALNQTQFSPDGNKLAIAYFEFSGNVYKFILADFNRCTGLLNNVNSFNIPNDGTSSGVSGVEFSSSGRFLYVSNGSNLYQFDLLNANIQNSSVLVGVHDHLPSPFPSFFNNSKRGPDGRIYMATGNGNYGVDIVNYPDSQGVACDIQLRQINYFTLFGSSGIGILVMPKYPDYTLGPLAGSPCDTLTGITNYIENGEPFEIFPIPSGGSFTINYNTGNHKNTKFQLTDIFGRQIFSVELRDHSIQHQIVLPESIANGVYVGRVMSGKVAVSGKVVLQK